MRRQNNEDEITELKQQLLSSPGGKLICVRNGEGSRWYSSFDGEYYYIPKKEQDKAVELAVKKYTQARLEDLIQENKLLDYILRKSDTYESKVNKLVASPSFMDLLSKYHVQSDGWSRQSYPQCRMHPEELVYASISGKCLRSKSEVIIDMYLCHYKIPHRYECELPLGSDTVYPTFTIKHPKTGKTFYWDYCAIGADGATGDYARKMSAYINNSIYPSVNLISTVETKDYPLSALSVEETIKGYFL